MLSCCRRSINTSRFTRRQELVVLKRATGIWMKCVTVLLSTERRIISRLIMTGMPCRSRQLPSPFFAVHTEANNESKLQEEPTFWEFINCWIYEIYETRIFVFCQLNLMVELTPRNLTKDLL